MTTLYSLTSSKTLNSAAAYLRRETAGVVGGLRGWRAPHAAHSPILAWSRGLVQVAEAANNELIQAERAKNRSPCDGRPQSGGASIPRARPQSGANKTTAADGGEAGGETVETVSSLGGA